MEQVAQEFFKLFFSLPVMILFALAVVGLSNWFSRRSHRKFRSGLEWKGREAWMHSWGASPELIQRSRERFYKERGLKLSRGGK